MRQIITIVIIFMLLICTGCQNNNSAKESSLHVAALTGPLTMNPLFLRDAASAEVAALLHPQLLVTDPKTLMPQARLFSSWQLLEDNLTYVFSLHEDAYWSDGKPVTAEDVAFTMRVICHPDYTGPLFQPLRYITGAEGYKLEHSSPYADGDISGIEVIDEKTLKISLKENYAPFLTMLTFAPVPAHILSGVEVAQMESHTYSHQLPVSAGPYLLVEWNDEYLHVRANPHYFLGKPSINNIYYRYIPNQEAQLIELLAGKLDLIPTAVKVEDIKNLKNNPDIKIYHNPRLVYDYLALNTRKADSPLSNKKVRKAFTLLLNRQEIVKNLLLNYGTPLYGPILPLHFPYKETQAVDEVDLAAARRLLVEAGYKKLKLDLIYNVGNTVRENVALLLKEQAAKVGIDIQINLLEWEAFLSAVNEGDYDLAILGRGVEADPDLTFHWHSQSRGNSLGYANSEVDHLLEQGVATMDKNEREKIYQAAEAMIVEDVPAIWLYVREAIHAATVKLQNFNPHPENIFYNVHEWTLADEEEVS
ncbi:MAG: hypothetical protein GX893_07260 [Firmicutes bacterium]|nr:hypothetical protein [Bacillota bacterium]